MDRRQKYRVLLIVILSVISRPPLPQNPDHFSASSKVDANLFCPNEHAVFIAIDRKYFDFFIAEESGIEYVFIAA